MTKNLAVTDPAPPLAPADTLAPIQASPMGMMQMLIEKGKDINPAVIPGMMKELAQLQYMMEDREAAKEFAAAKARFKANCPTIHKNRKAEIVSKDGGNRRTLEYADLPEIVRIVDPVLAAEGLDYSWDTEDVQGKIKCTCILKHVNGHSERASWTTTTETNAAMSPQQKVAAAFTFARRQTLIAILGLTTVDADNDAMDSAGMRPITKEQCDSILSFLAELGIEEGKFMAIFGLTEAKKLPALKYADAMRMLDARKKAKGSKA